MFKKLQIAIFLLCNLACFAQVTIKGKVFNEYLEPFSNAKIYIGNTEVISDLEGKFIIKTKKEYPINVFFSAFGYQTENVKILDNNEEINVILKEAIGLNEIVVSASRSAERIIESPVTIEKMGLKSIIENTSVTYYDGLTNLKGIDMHESSYGFKTLNTRGFSTFGNFRFVQVVDGIDSSVPSFNFTMGNLMGLSDLDVEKVEILPGASSALYGANAFNGIAFINSKNPHKYSGISAYFKRGYTTQKEGGNTPFYDFGLRMAYQFSDFFAAKANLTYFDAEEWHANDTRNTNRPGGSIIKGDNSLPSYDGVNIYGDEVGLTLKQIAVLGGVPSSVISSLLSEEEQKTRINRTGYNEKDLLDYNSRGLKLNGALHYRPFGNSNFEIIWNSRLSRSDNTIYQGVNRYSQKNIFVQQHKLEFNSKNFLVRGYYTANDAGDYYDTRLKAIGINNSWKSNEVWFGEYLNTYLTTRSHQQSRNIADIGRLEAGTIAFNEKAKEIEKITINNGGAKVIDKTSFYHVDFNYNFKEIIKFGEILMGGSYRKNILNSQGTVFTDKLSKIYFEEFGVYSQLKKKFFNNKLNFTGSLRYDKSLNFKGNFSPRISFNYALDNSNSHLVRASYQTAFRNPTSQEQYFGLPVGTGHILGGVKNNMSRYSVDIGGGRSLTGIDAINNSFSVLEVERGNFNKSDINYIKPEEVSSYELGYRGILKLNNFKTLEIDFNTYYNIYENFTTIKDVFVPHYGGFNTDGTPNAQALNALSLSDVTMFSINTNSNANVISYGFGLGLKTKIFNNFDFGLSYNLDKFSFDETSDPDYETLFNAPSNKFKLQFGKPNIFKNVGFNVNLRWQDDFFWRATFLQASIEARTVLDAQINFKIPKLKSRFKIGGTNLTGKEYTVAPGSGKIGSLYYISWSINN